MREPLKLKTLRLLYKRTDPHLVLDHALALLSLSKDLHEAYKDGIRLVSSKLIVFNSDYYAARAIITMILTLHSFLKAAYYGSREDSIIIIREFSNIFALLFFVVIYKYRGRVLLNINHNLSGGQLFEQKRWIINFLIARGFKFLLLDGQKHNLRDASLNPAAFLTPLFPISIKRTFVRSLRTPKTVVGLVGDFREEKISGFDRPLFLKTMSYLITSNKIDLIVGTTHLNRAISFLDGLANGGKILDTRTRYAYDRYMHSLDIIIILANEQSYRFRHSGTIMDAVSRLVIPIAPNLPIFRSQVNEPISIGLTYDSVVSIQNTIESAIENRGVFLRNMNSYEETRRKQLLNFTNL